MNRMNEIVGIITYLLDQIFVGGMVAWRRGLEALRIIQSIEEACVFTSQSNQPLRTAGGNRSPPRPQVDHS